MRWIRRPTVNASHSAEDRLLTGDQLAVSALTEQDRVLFDIAPVPIWLEDWSEVEIFCTEMRRMGVADLRT